jgi:hypothetical protein
MSGNFTERLRELTGTSKCISCGTDGHRRDMFSLKEGYLCRQCLAERLKKAKAEIDSLGLKGHAQNEASIIRAGRRLFGGSYNTQHIIEYDHRYICEHCGHFGVKKCKRIVYNSGQFHNVLAGDLCDCCGSGNIWYIDVIDSDITSTHDHAASGLYWSTSRA